MLKLTKEKTLILAAVDFRELITSKSELRNVTVMFRLHQRAGNSALPIELGIIRQCDVVFERQSIYVIMSLFF